MGGDLAPEATVEGAVAAARDFGIEIVLVGDLDLVTRKVTEHRTDGLKMNRRHPLRASRWTSRRWSRCYQAALLDPRRPEMVKRGDASAFVSAGDSVVMAATMMILRHAARRRPPRDRFAGTRQRWLRAY